MVVPTMTLACLAVALKAPAAPPSPRPMGKPMIGLEELGEASRRSRARQDRQRSRERWVILGEGLELQGSLQRRFVFTVKSKSADKTLGVILGNGENKLV